MHYDSESNKNEHRWEAAIIASVPNHHSGFRLLPLQGGEFGTMKTQGAALG